MEPVLASVNVIVGTTTKRTDPKSPVEPVTVITHVPPSAVEATVKVVEAILPVASILQVGIAVARFPIVSEGGPGIVCCAVILAHGPASAGLNRLTP